MTPSPGIELLETGQASVDSVQTASATPRKLLLVTFDFPPRRTSGVYRPIALTRYLVANGWHSTVLTVVSRARLSGRNPEDASLLDKLPREVTVVRTGYISVGGLEEP